MIIPRKNRQRERVELKEGLRVAGKIASHDAAVTPFHMPETQPVVFHWVRQIATPADDGTL